MRVMPPSEAKISGAIRSVRVLIFRMAVGAGAGDLISGEVITRDSDFVAESLTTIGADTFCSDAGVRRLVNAINTARLHTRDQSRGSSCATKSDQLSRT